MKTKSFLSIMAMCLTMVFSVSSCADFLNRPHGPNDPGGDTPGGDTPGGGGGGGQTQAAADIFKAFDKVGNEFWYQWYLSGSYQASGGRKTYKSAKCTGWRVTAVSGNSATVDVYTNFDFAHPLQMTFTRGSDGSLFMNGKQVTNTQSPEFYLLNFGKTGNFEWKEFYSNGEYTNVFYTKGDGYTSVERMIDITETWNSYGLAGSQENEITNSDAGSSNLTLTLKRAKTAYTSMGSNLSVQGVTLTGIENITLSSTSYIRENPTASAFRVDFTHNCTNTWGYGIGMYLSDGNGHDAWYPFFNINDISTYVKSYVDEYDNWGAGGDILGAPITDFSATSHSYYFFLTPAAVELGKSWGFINFCIFALGWGPDNISTIDDNAAGFSITFDDESGMQARKITDRRNLKPLPLRVND